MSEETFLSMYASFLLLVVLTHGRMPKFTFVFFTNLRVGMEFRSLSADISPLELDVFEDFSRPSSALAFEFGAGEDDRPFSL